MRILMAGTGRMGRDLGLRFLASGLDVAWASRDPARLDALQKRLQRDLRRLAGDGGAPGRASFLAADGTGGDGAPFDALLESVEEDPEAKRAVLAHWRPRLAPGALVLTNASSILPAELGPDVLGFHGFYPATLTGFCEIVLPDGCPTDLRLRTVALAARAGLTPLVQDGAHAFAVNRLLVPSQDWALRQVMAGADPAEVDAAFVKGWPGFEPLAMMDAIGLRVVAAAVARYRERMGARDAAACAALAEGLRALVQAGKTGAREGDGIRQGRPLPWPRADVPTADLAGDASALFRNTVDRALARGDLDLRGLRLVMLGLFGVQYDAPSGAGRSAALRDRCLARAAGTGLAYWEPLTQASGEPDPASGDES